MLTTPRDARRRGMTLVELVVALTIGGLLLASIVAIAVRQQRLFSDLGDATALDGHLREAASILPVDLRALAPTLGDIRDARDTALEVRATIATAVTCDTNGSRLLLAPTVDLPPATRAVARLASLSTPIVAGDTAWFLSATDTSDDWVPFVIAGVGTAAAGQCTPFGPTLDATSAATSRVAITLATSPPTSIGVPIRITRPLRYSLYHASDNDWYLGERDWNAATGEFNIIQPITGPFLSPNGGGAGVQFTYFDSLGTALGLPIGDPSTIRTIGIVLRGQTRNPVRALTAAGAERRRTDSAKIVVALRGDSRLSASSVR